MPSCWDRGLFTVKLEVTFDAYSKSMIRFPLSTRIHDTPRIC
jgi:hypothetical protein